MLRAALSTGAEFSQMKTNLGGKSGSAMLFAIFGAGEKKKVVKRWRNNAEQHTMSVKIKQHPPALLGD